MFRPLPSIQKTYQTIVADPPWPYKAPGQFGCTLEHRPNRDTTKNKLGAGSRSRYGAMSIQDLCSLEVSNLVAPNAHLYLWTTNSFVCEAHILAKAWGFSPKTLLTYVKIKPDGTPSMKMGYNFRGATEHIVFAVRGSLRIKGTYPTAFLWPRLPHSQKPEEFYQLVEVCSPGPRLELFARRERLGWDRWGNEVNCTPGVPLKIFP